MSRMYRISVSEGVDRVIHVGDNAKTRLEIIEMVDHQTTTQLLAQELARQGFALEAGKGTKILESGVKVTIDLNTGDVDVRLEQEEKVSVTVTKEGHRDTDWDQGLGGARHGRAAQEEKLREAALEEGHRQIDAAETNRRAEVTRALERALPTAQRLLEDVGNAVTREGLKLRAKSIGEIEEITESPNGDLSIKVRC